MTRILALFLTLLALPARSDVTVTLDFAYVDPEPAAHEAR